MTTLYSFRYEHEFDSVAVHFVDNNYDIINAEQLAQIESRMRREWSSRMINFIQNSKINKWPSFDLEQIGLCSFGRRLKIENWNNPAVVLRHADNQLSLYIFRYYLFIYFYIELFTLNIN